MVRAIKMFTITTVVLLILFISTTAGLDAISLEPTLSEYPALETMVEYYTLHKVPLKFLSEFSLGFCTLFIILSITLSKTDDSSKLISNLTKFESKAKEFFSMLLNKSKYTIKKNTLIIILIIIMIFPFWDEY